MYYLYARIWCICLFILILYNLDDVEERLKKITRTGFIELEHELHFIPLPYLSLLKYILFDCEKNEDIAILTICKSFKDKYDSFLKDNKYDLITRLTLPLFYVTLIKIDGRPLKELVCYVKFVCIYTVLWKKLSVCILFSQYN